jgi:hypothetical protein
VQTNGLLHVRRRFFSLHISAVKMRPSSALPQVLLHVRQIARHAAVVQAYRCG